MRFATTSWPARAYVTAVWRLQLGSYFERCRDLVFLGLSDIDCCVKNKMRFIYCIIITFLAWVLVVGGARDDHHQDSPGLSLCYLDSVCL